MPLPASGATAARHAPPRVWALMSDTIGDNAQVLALAEALGWPFEIQRFHNRKGAVAANLVLGAAPLSLVCRVSGEFGPPWPDLVIAAGTPSEPICAQIRAACSRAAHPLCVVFLGRPWAPLDRYDLVVTTPQYYVPPAENVLTIDLPLHRVRAEDMAREAAHWAPQIAHLPRPYVVVLVGGSISRYTLDDRAARRLAVEAGALAASRGGSLLVCSSHRTPPRAMEILAETIAVPSRLFDWRSGLNPNPYVGLLGLADELVVTGDSMSMLADACSTGKPVHIFDLGEGRYGMRQPPVAKSRTAVDGPWLASAVRARMKNLELRLVRALLPLRFHRETGHIHRQLVQSRRAVWLGDSPPAAQPAPARGIEAVARRIRTRMEVGQDH